MHTNFLIEVNLTELLTATFMAVETRIFRNDVWRIRNQSRFGVSSTAKINHVTISVSRKFRIGSTFRHFGPIKFQI